MSSTHPHTAVTAANEPAPSDPDTLRLMRELQQRLGEVRAAALRLEAAHAADIDAADPAWRASARNLLHYLGVRRHDIRVLQGELIACGLSSLSNMESCTLASIDSVLANLAILTGSQAPAPAGVPVDLRGGPQLLADHAGALLGPVPDGRATRIMVTTPSEAAHDPALVDAETQPLGDTGRIGISAGIVQRATDGDRLRLTDARGKTRELPLTRRDARTLLASVERTVYLQGGAVIELWCGNRRLATGSVGRLPPVSAPIVLHNGDALPLTREDRPGRDAERDASGAVISVAHVHCSLEAAFRQVRNGDPVSLDDGRIGGIVEDNDGTTICVRITRTGPAGSRLGAGKGINFPATRLDVPALTARDLADLEAVAGFADIVALSFLRDARDVSALLEALGRIGANHLGIVLKIENRQAFENLPAILLASLRAPNAQC